MTKDRFTENILKKIKCDHLTPKPKWHFMLRNIAIWSTGILSVIVGGIAISVIIFVLVNSDWDAHRQLHGGPLSHFIVVLPYAWLLLLLLFVTVANFQFKHTKKGYQHKVQTLIFLSIFGSVLLGAGLYGFGLAHHIDRGASHFVPGYHDINERRELMWSHPEGGLLAGEILGMSEDDSKTFRLRDFKGKIWIVNGRRLDDRQFVIMEFSKTVAIIGIPHKDNVFEACAIRPWQAGPEGLEVRGKIYQMIMERESRSGTSTQNKIEGRSHLKAPLDMRKGKMEAERNIFDLRNNVCERGTPATHLLGPKN